MYLVFFFKFIQLADHEETKKEFELLRLFAFGTYQDFKDQREYFESVMINEKDRHDVIYKLKQLTVVSMSSKQRVLPYARLQNELDIGNVRELEDLLIDAMYQELLKGKLDQKEKYFEVYESIGRDIHKDNIDEMILVLRSWSEHCDTVLKNLEQHTQNALSSFEARKQYALSQNKLQEDIARNMKASFDMSDIDMVPHGVDDFEETRSRRSGPSRGRRLR